MASGNLMASYLEDNKSIRDTEKLLRQAYDGRVQFGPPEESLLLIDWYLSRMVMDSVRFTVSADWGIVSISPEDEAGNAHIREIVQLMVKPIDQTAVGRLHSVIVFLP